MDINIKSRKITSGGLKDMQGAVSKKLEWILSIPNKNYVSKEYYNDYMNWLFAAMYVFGINGRKSGEFDDNMLKENLYHFNYFRCGRYEVRSGGRFGQQRICSDYKIQDKF
jgi:hypothetical protein